MQGYFQAIGSGVSGCYCYLYALDGINIPAEVYRSRGPASENGSGPYFKARRESSSFKVGTTEYNCEPTFAQNSYASARPNFYAATKAINGVAFIITASGIGTVNGVTQVTRITFLRCSPYGSGRKVEYLQETFSCKTSKLFIPSTLEGWKASFRSVCNQVLEVYDSYSRVEGWRAMNRQNIDVHGAHIEYRLNELSAFQFISDLQIYPKGFAAGFSTAYVNAVADLDLASVNTLQNIKEAVEGLIAVVNVIRNPVEAWRKFYTNFLTRKEVRNFSLRHKPGEISQLWLKYRYQYQTTKMDLEEYRELITRIKQLKLLLGKDIHTTGQYTGDYGSFRAELRVAVRDIFPEDFGEKLAAIGLEPNAVNIWDMVPYSFIVDWFFHIDELMAYVDKIGNSIDLPVKDTWFTYMSEYDSQHVFFRVSGRRLEVPPIYVEKQASTTTIKMRVADVISLILGR